MYERELRVNVRMMLFWMVMKEEVVEQEEQE
jgi:hypothetical protein